jgi:hypothetical protein
VQAAGPDVLHLAHAVAVDETIGRVGEQIGDRGKPRMGMRRKGGGAHFEPVDVEDRIDQPAKRLAGILEGRECGAEARLGGGEDWREGDHGVLPGRVDAGMHPAECLDKDGVLESTVPFSER